MMTVTQARRKNIAKARAALAVKRAEAKRALLDETRQAFEVMAGGDVVRPTPTKTAQDLASDDVSLQTLQAALDQAGWQLSVLHRRLRGLL